MSLAIFDRKVGGKLRATVMAIATIATVVAAAINAVDWEAPLWLSIPTVVQLIAHYTKIGDSA